MKLHAALASILLLTASYAQAGPNLVLNGDFETADYSMWTLSSPGGGGQAFGVDVTGSPLADDTNNVFGDLNTAQLGFLRQTITTIAGATYQLKFDLQRWTTDPQFPPDNRAQVNFGATTVFNESNITGDWSSHTLIVTALSSSTLLEFGNFNNDPIYWNQLDNISLEFLRGPNDPGVPEPATLALLAGGLAALRFSRRRTHRS
ncbi:PEP-CTERM protein-sorting domain-containing protein [Duganella sp. CF458]|uniref:PEP-CTERM sorting domain-containing protein n=1 Tax=Duganella sp. CF458 TaxID=1884368 RepID=UPI0008F10B11|nr:PEP-CTERM sorting domain-containing protein [Duganella sp. CF458]SFG80800.1 PEP-CTERM protein-sorting domain-containing protein [Duganella sp. CF458]